MGWSLLQQKITKLTEGAEFEKCAPVVYSSRGRGKYLNLFKVLVTNKCEHNCFYCENRKEREVERYSFLPQELGKLFMEYYQRGWVCGLFLSSGVERSADYSQEKILETVRFLRKKCNYTGYIHAKILPNSSEELIYEMCKYVNRLSLNLEAPGDNWLRKLSKEKQFLRMLNLLTLVKQRFPQMELATQFVVGGIGESDLAILKVVERLYKLGFHRVYYSKFTPVKNTPMENITPTSSQRELRLYQADSLLKYYGFKSKDLIYTENYSLPLSCDPKLLWCRMHPEFFPVKINSDPLWRLIRIPGIGVISGKKILTIRKERRIRNIEELKKVGIPTKHIKPYISFE